MTLVAAQFDKQDKSIQAITAKNAVLNKEIDTQKEKIAALKLALENASTSFGENDKRTKDWIIQLNNAEAELIGMEKELGKNIKTLDEAGNEMDEAGKEADEFGRHLDGKPRVSYVLSAMDLSVLTEYAHEEWALGDIVTVDDRDLNMTIRTRVVRRQYNPQEPWKTVLELSSKLRELGDSSNEALADQLDQSEAVLQEIKDRRQRRPYRNRHQYSGYPAVHPEMATYQMATDDHEPRHVHHLYRAAQQHRWRQDKVTFRNHPHHAEIPLVCRRGYRSGARRRI